MLVFVVETDWKKKKLLSFLVINQTKRNSFDQNQKRPSRMVLSAVSYSSFFFGLHASPRNCTCNCKVLGTAVSHSPVCLRDLFIGGLCVVRTTTD